VTSEMSKTAEENSRKPRRLNRSRWAFVVLLTVLVLAAVTRFGALGHPATRSDELNMMHYAMGSVSLTELWTKPPWLNQIPLADSIPVLWTQIQPWRVVGEGMVREPFAFLGWLTVAFCAVWMTRRRGIGAGILLGMWMAVLPFHVYHSREAYYYVLVMLFSSGMALRGADFMVRLKASGSLKAREYAEWTAWTLMACLSHMSAWVVAVVLGLMLTLSGWTRLKAVERKRHALAMGFVTLVLGAGMIRWVWRAFQEMQRTASTSTGHIGSAFDWVGLRVLPFFSGGANAVGIGILAAVLLAVVAVFWWSRGKPGREDPLYGAVMRVAIFGLLGSYAYIFAVGGGEKAKLTYFAANLPAFLAWGAMTLDKAFARAGKTRRLALDLGAAVLILGLLILPTWKVIQLDGKATPYRPIRAWLDTHLAPGDVVMVDRWLEPWNEMAFYAPSNVTMTFTVPDDPYENYVNYKWRKVTKELFQRNGAQAFIRIARTQEKRMGLWRWPETWFHHRAVVTNEAGLWLRDTGFAPMEEFYSETNRVLTEIFYDTHEDIANRARSEGRAVVWFFGEGWRLFKPWQQGDFSDYHILGDNAVLTVYNLRPEPIRVRGNVVAAASGGNPVIQIGSGAPLTFLAGQMGVKPFDLDLQPGPNTVFWKKLNQAGVLLVRDLRMDLVE